MACLCSSKLTVRLPLGLIVALAVVRQRCVLVLASSSSAAVIQEYCDDKSFVPTCSASDEVIIMEQATYGRMRLGKCVPETLTYAYSDKCSANVLSFVEHKCSGRRSCSGVLKELFSSELCESLGLRNFLEASYSCIKGRLKFICTAISKYKYLKL
jgi:hypothetical protein